MSSIYYKNQKYTGPTLDLGSGSLTTDDKTIVGAINELDTEVDGIKAISRRAYTTTTNDSAYIIAGAIFFRTGNMCILSFNGLKDVPVGGWTTLMTPPAGFIPNTSTVVDLYANTSINASPNITLRFQISSTELKVYNYGSSIFTNANWRPQLVYAI